MAKLAVTKKVGVPVPSPMPTDVTHLVAYFGEKGFTPAYDQANRLAVPIGEVEKRNVNGTEHFVFDTAKLPPMGGDELDIYFTLADNRDAEEGDFSPVVSVPLDREPPVALGQPVVLDE